MPDPHAPRRAHRKLGGIRTLYRLERRTPPGSAPGTLVVNPEAAKPHVTLIRYGPDEIDEQEIADVAALKDVAGKSPVTWVNIEGLGDIELIGRIGEIFGLHRLALEDVVNVHQRPKVEEYEGHAFIVARMALGPGSPETEQIAMFLGDNFVLTFQERVGDCFDPIRDRLRHRKGRLRGAGADYLAYALLDAVIDNFFPVLEAYGERLEEIETAVMAEPEPEDVGRLHELKRDLLTVRRAIWPQREMINALTREQVSQISYTTQPYLRDCYDHLIQLIDVLETYREIASGLVDVYLSSVSAKLNEIMKVLTIIATVFIPLSFIASVYGMNFDTKISPWNMPELGWRYGYPFSLAVMAAIVVVLLLWFRRRGWMGGRPRRRAPHRRRR
jgi:magnesium transporter